MRNAIIQGLLIAGVLLLAGCGTPEAECRSGVDQLKQRMEGLIGSGDHKEASDPVVKAHTAMGYAEAQLAVGNFEGCIETLRDARGHLRASQRSNVQ